jgi:hypothetical protein
VICRQRLDIPLEQLRLTSAFDPHPGQRGADPSEDRNASNADRDLHHQAAGDFD